MVWFDEHAEAGRYRLLVAEENGSVIGYASTGRFRDKRAYDTTAETSVYCAPEATGRGVGSALYRELFITLAGEDINRLAAGITLPNDASIALHKRFGFVQSVSSARTGASSDVTGMSHGSSGRLSCKADSPCAVFCDYNAVGGPLWPPQSRIWTNPIEGREFRCSTRILRLAQTSHWNTDCQLR
jgi:hypothetical protein